MMTIRRKIDVKKWFRLVLIFFFMGISLMACKQNQVYEQSYAFEANSWYYDNVLNFETNIEDINALYHLQIHVRHTNEYAYSNLWLKIKTIYPDGEERTDPLNIPMADDEGRWYGGGIGTVLTNDVTIQKNASLQQTGTYRFEIYQDMRVNPMTEIMNVGFSVEKMGEGE